MAKRKILLLGNTGKMGTALKSILEGEYRVIGRNSGDFNALNPDDVYSLVEETAPDIVINTVAFLGIDPSEKDPVRAFRLNTLYPKHLAELSNEKGFLLIHFSTDAVFDDSKRDYYTEGDCPLPINMYGLTKYGGDCSIQTIASNYYIFRIPVLFGETSKNTQFVEKMLQRVKGGERVLRISDDIISSPSYSRDIAREVKRILEEPLPSGLYHIANKGMASLYDLMSEIAKNLKIDVTVERASYRDFPYLGRKNTFTPIRSEKVAGLRPWQEAVIEYCKNISLREQG